MPWIPFLALVLWLPAVCIVFEKYPFGKAIVFSFVTAWLFLPPTQIPLSGFPDWSKTTATVVSVTLCCWLKQPQRLFAIRPRLYDLPVIAYCFVPFASAITNGVGAYDGFSACLEEIVRWGLPYLIGRAYLASPSGNRQLCLGVAIGGMSYVPLCLVEIRMSPQLKSWVYGFDGGRPVDFGLRYGGYRPMVFLSTGLELGWWMCCASLAAFMLWRSGTVRHLCGYPMWALTLVLGLVTVACKSTGALMQIALGFALIFASRRLKTAALVWALVAIGPSYCISRPLGLWTGESLVSWAGSAFGADRAESLGYRFACEEVLMRSALQRPVFGWGRGGGFNPPDASGKSTVTDGLWIIVFGWQGGAGLAMLNAMLLVPTLLFLKRHRPRTWFDPDVAPLATLALILPLFMVDNLSNAMINPIYAIAMGSLTGCVLSSRASTARGGRPEPGAMHAGAPLGGPAGPLAPPRAGAGSSPRDLAADLIEEEADEAVAAGRDEEGLEVLARAIRARQLALNAGHSADRLDRLARAHVARARALAGRGDGPGAIAEREQAQAVWKRLAGEGRLAGDALAAHAANLNDLAWGLVDDGTDAGRLDRAVLLAEEALASDPDQASFWNTLGIARYRRGDHHKAIHALSQAVARGDGGNAFDFYYLALANHALGYPGPAAGWLERADSWARERPSWAPMLAGARAEVARSMRAQPVA